MKKIILLLMCLTGTSYLFAQNGFVLKAKISGADNYRLFLSYNDNGKMVRDTNYTIEEGRYVFRGTVSEPTLAYLGVIRHPALIIRSDRGIVPGPSLNFFLSNDNIQIDGDAATIYMATVKGGRSNDEWRKNKKEEGQYEYANWNLLRKMYEDSLVRKDSVAYQKVQHERMMNVEKLQATRKSFRKNNPHSLVSMHFLSMEVNSLSFEELKAAYEALGDEYKQHPMALRIAQKIKSMEATAVGKDAVPINKRDKDGNPVNLSTLKGKYVLVDFWGSWCGPCRMSHPHLKALYAKYKDKGFEILGVSQETRQSLEECRKAWLDAIEKDGITWLQVLNNEGIEQFDAVKAYGVSAFPTKILLDREGKVVARYVGEGGTDFDKKLQEIFGF